MNIKQFLKKNGYETECDVDPYTVWVEVIVAFTNSSTGADDETSFDVQHPFTENGKNELSDLFRDFCKEEGIKNNTVTGIVITNTAQTYNELVA